MKVEIQAGGDSYWASFPEFISETKHILTRKKCLIGGGRVSYLESTTFTAFNDGKIRRKTVLIHIRWANQDGFVNSTFFNRFCNFNLGCVRLTVFQDKNKWNSW